MNSQWRTLAVNILKVVHLYKVMRMQEWILKTKCSTEKKIIGGLRITCFQCCFGDLHCILNKGGLDLCMQLITPHCDNNKLMMHFIN